MADEPESKPAKVKPEAKPSPGIRLEYALAAALVLLIAAAAFYYLQPKGAAEISLSDFKAVVNATGKMAVVQDLRALPSGDADARMKLQNCAVQISFALSYLGKNVTNYAIEGDQCYGGSSTSARSTQECLGEAAREGRLMFTLGYNSTQNKTSLAAGGASYTGDAGFLSDCTLAGLVR